jgi:hypothetical protein
VGFVVQKCCTNIKGDVRHQGDSIMIKILNGVPVLSDEINKVQHGDIDSLQKLLEKGKDLGVFIATHQFRGIGKTHALIEFARKNNFIIIIPNKLVLQDLKEQYKYNNIVEPSCVSIFGKSNGYVLDEGINIQTLRKMYPDINVVTGWFDSFSNKENVKTFNENVTDNLKNELESLTTLVKRARENGDFGTYKNLILAYKEVLGLYKELTNEDFNIPITYNFHIENVKTIDVDDFMEKLRRRVSGR